MENILPSLQDRVVAFLKANIVISALFLGGVILLSIGLIQFLGSKKNQIEFQKGEEISAESKPSGSSVIMVDVSGAVEKPGVYTLQQNARVQDALKVAGGLAPEADKGYVSKSMNLASPLRDGVKIYIPRVGEEVSAAVSTLSGEAVVSINSASQETLEELPGIGPVSAGKIVSSRPFASIDELVEKKIVGESIYNKIKDQISL